MVLSHEYYKFKKGDIVLSITEELNKIPLDYDTTEYTFFKENSVFIDKTIEVLNSNDISYKKNYFLDNQENIMKSINGIKLLIDKMSHDAENHSTDIKFGNVYKLANITVRKLEDGITKFNKELLDQVNGNTKEEKIVLDEESIKDALQNNESTKQMMKDLESRENINIDEKTANIRENFNQLIEQKRNLRKKPDVSGCAGYLIASQDFSQYTVIPSKGRLSNEELNKVLENIDIEDARVFTLKELPTKKKTITKTVTVLL